MSKLLVWVHARDDDLADVLVLLHEGVGGGDILPVENEADDGAKASVLEHTSGEGREVGDELGFVIS